MAAAQEEEKFQDVQFWLILVSTVLITSRAAMFRGIYPAQC